MIDDGVCFFIYVLSVNCVYVCNGFYVVNNN